METLGNPYEKSFQQQALAGQMSDTATKQMGQQFILEEKEKSMIHEQLDLTEEILRLEHLLRGHVQRDDNGRLIWEESTDPDMIIFTEYGIHLILNTIAWYINKNTLLSNYDDVTIQRKMRNFSHTLNDTVFGQYERVFKMPTLDECKEVLNDKVEKEAERIAFSYELKGYQADKEKIIKDIEQRLDVKKELLSIADQMKKSRMSRYVLLIREVQDAIHSTYNRAYMGQERKTLREHIHVSEARGMFPQQEKGGGVMKWLRGG